VYGLRSQTSHVSGPGTQCHLHLLVLSFDNETQSLDTRQFSHVVTLAERYSTVRINPNDMSHLMFTWESLRCINVSG
jgi:hypothetical protein